MHPFKFLEYTLTGLFDAAPPLSKSSKQAVVEGWPWVALILGILQLAGAWALWHLVHVANVLRDLERQLPQHSNVGINAFDRVMIYLGILVLLVDALMLLSAYMPLRARQYRGWKLLFFSTLINFVYGLIEIFINGRGITSFVLVVLESIIILYVLFQVRNQYAQR